MLAALLLIAPLGLAGAVSPVLLTEQTVLLAGPGGRRAATQFATGAILALLIFAAAIVLFGQALSLPTEPDLSASLDLVVGLILLAVALLLRARGHRKDGPRGGEHAAEATSDEPSRARAAFPFGVLAMATNFTTLPLVAAGAKEIAAADVGTAGRVFLVLILVALASAPAWLPIALTSVAPGAGQRALTAFGDFIARRGRSAAVVLLAGAGLFFAIRGVVRLLG